jgi:hypothetical protein
MQSTQQTSTYNAVINLLCMNARIERAMNSENFDARIMETELWIKRYGSGSFQGKTVFLGGFGGYLWNFRVVGGFWRKRQGLLRSLEIFCGFLGSLEWSRT